MKECCDGCHCFWRGTILTLLFLVCAFLFAACKSTPDPRDGPTEAVSNIPWNRQQSWEGNPYGTQLPGTR